MMNPQSLSTHIKNYHHKVITSHLLLTFALELFFCYLLAQLTANKKCCNYLGFYLLK